VNTLTHFKSVARIVFLHSYNTVDHSKPIGGELLSPLTYDLAFHVHILRFHWDFFILFIMRRQLDSENSKL